MSESAKKLNLRNRKLYGYKRREISKDTAQEINTIISKPKTKFKVGDWVYLKKPKVGEDDDKIYNNAHQIISIENTMPIKFKLSGLVRTYTQGQFRKATRKKWKAVKQLGKVLNHA